MKNLYLPALLLLSFLFFACGSETAEQGETSDQAEPASEEPAVVSSYETTVLKSDIPSPRKEMKGVLNGDTVVVNYGSPSVKGRTIWGELVPYDQVWRTGANEATTFTVSKDIMVEGNNLPAGKYGLFTIPGENEWTVIFNKTADQWGAYEYDASKDALRVKVKPEMINESAESLEYQIDGSALVIRWEKMRLPVQLQ